MNWDKFGFMEGNPLQKGWRKSEACKLKICTGL